MLKQGIMFELLTVNHAKERNDLCESMSKQPLLPPFNTVRGTKILCDTQQNGVGAALLQCSDNEWKSIAYASKPLADAQQQYSQI